jgi:predicted amidophosphoribosyltransferase
VTAPAAPADADLVPTSPPLRAVTWLRGLGADVLDLALPRSCVGCGAPAVALCAACLAELTAGTGRRDPRPRPPALPPAFSAAAYGATARDAVLAHKERGDRGLTAPLGTALATAVAVGLAATETRPDGDLVLVPIPTARRAVAHRGDDTVDLIARSAVRTLRAWGQPVTLRRALRPRGRRADSAGLGAAARAANLDGAFSVRERVVRGIPDAAAVLLVDDVITTGATLVTATAALRAAGVDVTAVATVAATARHCDGRATDVPLRP